MLTGLNGGVTYPIGTVGAARQAEAILNNVRPQVAAITGFIPYGKGDNDYIDLNINIGGKDFNAANVATAVMSGDSQLVVAYLKSVGITGGFANTPSSAVTVRPLSLVDQATAGTLGQNSTPTSSTPVTQEMSQQNVTPMFTELIKGNQTGIFGLSPLMLGVIGIGLILFLGKD